MLYRPNSSWTWTFFILIFLEAVIVIALEATIFASFKSSLNPADNNVASSRTIPTFFSLIILGFAYQLLLVYDTLAQQNTIQVIGLCIYSAILCVCCAVQYNELHNAITVLTINNALASPDIWSKEKALQTAAIIITAFFTLGISFTGWKLYVEFAWETFRKVEADYEMRRRYLYFQLFSALLKFDGFFFLGLLVQLMVMTTLKLSTTFAVTAAIIPLTCILLFASAFFIRHEQRLGTIIIIALQAALLGFFVWRFEEWYSPSYYKEYLTSRKNLTLFGVLTIVLSVCTIVGACMCFRNFHQGLKPYISGGKKARMLEESFEMEVRNEYSRVPHDSNYE